MFEITKVFAPQIIQARCEASSSRGKETVLGVELGKVDVLALSVLRGLPEEDSKLRVMLQRLYLLLVFHELVLIVYTHVTIGVHALGEHIHGQQPLLLLV